MSIVFCGGALLQHGRAAAGDEGAEALFQRGVSDMQAAHYETACIALDDSHRAEPRPGALFTAAECYAQWGKPAPALERYQAYLAAVPDLSPEQRSRHQTRLELARQAVDRLTAELASLPPLPEAPPATSTVPHISPAPTPGASVTSEPASSPSTSPPSTSSPSTIVGWSLAGAGASGLLLGSVAGVLVWSAKGTAEDECQARDQTGKRPCSAAGYHAVQRGQDWGVVANVGITVGLLGLVAGAVVLLAPSGTGADPSAPAETAWEPWLDSAGNGMTAGLKGSW